MPYAKRLCLIVIASLVSHLQATPLQIDKEPTPALVAECRSAKTFRIVVEQSFGEATTVTLPFGETIRAVLKSTSLREVNDDADITIVAKAVGRALGANYSTGGFFYTGADLSGSLRVTVRTGLYCEASFKKRVDPPHMVYGLPSLSSPSTAPFNETFHVFTTKLCSMALDLFGVPVLLPVLKDRYENLRIGVVKALSRTSDPTAVDALIATFGDESSSVKETAVETLTRMPDARVTDALVKSLRSSSIDIRTRAAEVLSKRKDCCPVEPLLVAFEDRRGRTHDEIDTFRSMVALALGATKKPVALRRLIAGIRNKSERSGVRSSIAEALGQFQEPAAADALIALVENTREDKSVRSSAAWYVGNTCDPRAAPLLIQMLMDPQPDVRGGAAHSLRFFREARVVEALIRAVSKEVGVHSPATALESLEKLTGQTFSSAAGWQKWWQENKNTFEQQKQ